MWRKWLFTVLLCSVGLSLVASAPSQEKSYQARRFDVELEVLPGGDLLVTETVVFDFVGGPFTFVFRELPLDFTDGVTDIEASVDGRPYPPGEGAGQLESSGEDPLRLTFHFEPTGDRSRTFVLRYRLLGVVRQEPGRDLLVFQPLPDRYEYPIASSTITLEFPAGALPAGPIALDSGRAAVQQLDRQVRLRMNNLAPGETLVFTLPFPAGSLVVQPPQWQRDQARAVAQAPYWGAAAAAVVAAGLASLVAAYRRASPTRPRHPLTLDSPPERLAPALAGALTSSVVSPSWSLALGTLFDLAGRGVLEIVELPDKKWYRRHEFAIRRRQHGEDLQGHEQGLLSLLFERKGVWKSELRLKELQRAATGSRWKRFAEPLKSDLKAAGLVSQARLQARRRFWQIGVAFILLGLVVVLPLVVLAPTPGPWPILVFFALLLVGVAWTVAGSILNPLSDEAAARAAEWARFFAYLKQITRKKHPLVAEDFGRYLPYAATAGQLANWARRFEKEGVGEIPPYFSALSVSPADSMAAFAAMAASSTAAGSSSAGGAGAGAGAAGGGASGAG